MSLRVGLRPRLTALAALSVGIALLIGAVVLIGVLRSRLGDAATTSAQLRARDVAALAEVDALPARLALPGEESAFVQVVDARGSVIASTENIEGESAVVPSRPTGVADLVITMKVEPLDDAQPMRVAVRDAQTPDGLVTVYAGESLKDVTDMTMAMIALLAIGLPLLVLVVALVVWWAVGRTLRPVQQITHTLSDITASDLHRRVPVSSAADEVGELALTVNDTLERLDHSVETQRRLVADASHELRGPLAALRADLEISITHPGQTTWLDVARDTLGDVERLQHLTDDLLLLARLDAHQHRPHEPLDLAGIVMAEVGRVRRATITVTTAGLDEPTDTVGDREQLQRMIRNLVHNAEAQARSEISVSLTSVNEFVRLIVEDDGPGIPVEDRERVFERFVRLDAARTRDVGGTGLGLAIVSDVVASHHGTVVITDGDLEGASFIVELPVSGTGPDR